MTPCYSRQTPGRVSGLQRRIGNLGPGILGSYARSGVRYLFREFARKLAALERELKGRLDVQESAIVGILQRVLDILNPPRLPVPKRRRIGFRVEEGRPRYRLRRVTARSRA